MTDVFVSYTSDDRERARKLASALEARGWSVWWDRKIIAGQTFDRVIEQELETAKSVVVLWSKTSISSEWVKNEAAAASERGVLVPALIDNVKPPLEFRRKQTADMIGWEGDPSHAGFQALCDGVAAKSNIPAAAPHRSSTRPDLGLHWNRYLTFGAIAAVAIAVGLAAYRSLLVTPERGGVSDLGDKVEQASPRVRMVPSEEAQPTKAHGINDPLSIDVGTIYKVTLQKNEASYFRLSSPAADLRIVLDMRLADNRESNLQSTLSVLDQDSAVIQKRAIHFNEVDVGYRKTVLLPSMHPTIPGFRILNETDTADLWLTVLREPASQLVPFFGETVPKPLALGDSTSGMLDAGEYVYYITSLSRGDYKMVLDFANSKGENTNIQGYLALLDADGGNQTEILRLNEVDVSYRKTATFSVGKETSQSPPPPVATQIIKILNKSSGVNYTVKVTENP